MLRATRSDSPERPGQGIGTHPPESRLSEPANGKASPPPVDLHAVSSEPESHAAPWRRRFVPGFLARERLAGQVVRFGMVGVSNTVVDFAVLNLLLWVGGLPLLLANTLAYSAGIINSFLWNKHWTFSAGGSEETRRELAVFLLVSLSALAINDLVIVGLNSLHGGDTFLAINLQKAGASVLSMTWNFIGYRFLAFRSTAGRGSGPGGGS